MAALGDVHMQKTNLYSFICRAAWCDEDIFDAYVNSFISTDGMAWHGIPCGCGRPNFSLVFSFSINRLEMQAMSPFTDGITRNIKLINGL